MPRNDPLSPMTANQRRRGWVFFALYLLVFPYFNLWLQKALTGDAEPMVAEANVICYALLFLLSLLLFWRFLREDLSLLARHGGEALLCAAAGLAAGGGGRWLLERLPLGVADPTPGQYAEQYLLSPAATLVLVLVLIPVAEELLFRGLLFGALRDRSRLLAYLVEVPVYALAQVWRYAPERGDPRYLLTAVLYLPASLALTWCYDRCGSVWGCAVLHAALNALLLAPAL